MVNIGSGSLSKSMMTFHQSNPKVQIENFETNQFPLTNLRLNLSSAFRPGRDEFWIKEIAPTEAKWMAHLTITVTS